MNDLDRKIALVNKLILVKKAQTFNLEGFRAWFEFAHGSPLHQEGERWAENIFLAINTKHRKLLQEAFRGSGKTTVFSKMFLAFWIGHHPETTSLIIRINIEKAGETSAEVAKMIELDANWKLVFPHVVPDKDASWGIKSGYTVRRTDVSPGEWTDMQRGRPQGPTFIGYGYSSGSVIGSRTNGVMLVDDIHDKDNTRSDRQLSDVKDFVTDTLMPIPVPKQGVEIWNFTPWLSNDVYADRKQTGMYVHSRSPVMWEDEEGEAWPEVFGDEDLDYMSFPFKGRKWKLGWPERWGFEEIAFKYKDIGHIPFARMYLLDLDATKGQVLKSDWLHEYPAGDIDPSWPVIFGNDYASTVDKLKHKDRDYFATAVFRAIPGGGIVLVDGYKGHLSKGEGLEKTLAMAGTYPTLQKIGVESIGKGEEFYNDLALLNDMSGQPLPLWPIKHHKLGKGKRFEEWLAPRCQAARIWISNVRTPFINDFYNEWLTYPNAEHDDCLDAVYMGALAAETFMPSRTERSFKKERKPSPLKAWSNV